MTTRTIAASGSNTDIATIAFAAILHMAQSTPRHMLRQALDTRSMVSVTTAAFDAPLQDGGAEAPDAPGLGVTPDMDVMGDPVAVWEA